jgi:hypothetical protein
VNRLVTAILFALLIASPALAQNGGALGGGGSSISTPVSVPNGGSGNTSLASGAMNSGNGTGAYVPITPGASGSVLTSNGTGVTPSYQAVSAGGAASEMLVGSLVGANFNITTDQAITLTGPSGKWYISKIIITNCSQALTSAKGTFYAAASKTNIILGPSGATTAYSGIVASTDTAVLLQSATNGVGIATIFHFDYFTSSSQTIYLSLGQSQGTTTTCDIYVYGGAL